MKFIIPTILVTFFGYSLLNGGTISEVQENIKNGKFIEAKNSLSYVITKDSSNPPTSIPNSESNLEQDIPLPTSAYSLRKLVPNYSGYILRIRRSGDNLEADVSFDTNNKLSINSPVTIIGDNYDSYTFDNLEEFLNGGNGYVHTWYDQAGTNDAVQENTDKQPRISENGALLTDGIDFDGTDDFLNSSGVLTSNTSASIFTKVKALTSDATSIDYFYTEGFSGTKNSVSQTFGIGINHSGNIVNVSASTYIAPKNNRASSLEYGGLISLIGGNNNTKSYINGSLMGSISTPTNAYDNHTITTSGGIGGHSSRGSLSDFSIEELIIYNSDQTDNRSQIESNINNYYGLFKYNDEALIYKFINDIGYYYENTIPDYLVQNWNFVPGKTQTAFDYNPLNTRENPLSLELLYYPMVMPVYMDHYNDDLSPDILEVSLGSWEYYEDQPFPLVRDDWGMGIKSQYRLFSIYNWDLRKEIAPKFSHNDSGNGYYHAEADGALISFKYNPSNNVSKQVNFSIQQGYRGMLKVYVNGMNIGEVYNNGSIYLELENIESWNIVGILPLVLIPGDIVTFEAHENYWDDAYSGDFTIGPSIKPSIDSLADFESPENGVGYTITYPNYGDSKTIGDIFATATQEDLPSRKLLRSLINTLSLISAEANVVLPMSFTEANYDIIIQYEDAMMLKSILELYDTFLSIAGQYNLDVPYDYDTLVDFGPYKTFKAFFSDFPNALEGLADRLSDQADTKVNALSALTQLEEILPVMFDRGSLDSDSNDINTDLLYPSYLFTISDNSENEDLTDLLTQISSLKASLNGFINPSAITLSSDKGYNISLEPFVTENPFPIKNFIKDIEKDPLLSWKLYNDDSIENSKERTKAFELMQKYGLVKDYLPMSLEENILVFKNENGEIIKTIMNNDDYGGIYYSGSSGELYAEIFDFQESGDNDFFKLKNESNGTISWSYSKPDYTNSELQYVNYKGDWYSQKYEAEYRGGRLAVLNTPEKINSASSLIPEILFPGENSNPIVSIGAQRGSDNQGNNGIFWLDGSRLVESEYFWTENNPEGEQYMAMTTGGVLLDISYNDSFNDNNMGFIMEIPKTNTVGYSGEFLHYKASLDLNNNGKSDGVDMNNIGHEYNGLIKTTSLNYTNPLNSLLIQNTEDERIKAAPNKIMGMIFIHKESDHDDHNHSDDYYDYYYSNLLWPYEITYYISEYDSIGLDARVYENYELNSSYMERSEYKSYRKWSEYNYSNGIIHNNIWDYENDPTVLHFLTPYSGYHYNDGEEEKFVCYPGYLDMDNDGVSDASEITSGIIPYFIDYPSHIEIQYAIDAYADNDNNTGGIGDNINVNTNALEDLDNDNMPDALELKFGGNPSDSNDAQTSLDAIMSTESYSLNEIVDLRLGSTLYQVSEGLASFNIILEESADLNTWTPYGEYSMELSDDGDSDIKFFRFKMAD